MRKLALYITIITLVSCNRSFNDDLSGTGNGSGEDNVTIDQSAVNYKLKPVEYIAWVNDERHGLKREKTIDDMVYTAQYRPCDYVICEEERKEEIADTTVKHKLKDLEGMQYIDLKIALKSGQGELLKYNLTSTQEYQERVNYFAFDMQKDIQLVDGKDTLKCLLYHYERVYDIAPFGVFVLGFQLGKKHDADKTLLFNDHGFNKGTIKFFFDGKSIKYLPQLQTI